MKEQDPPSPRIAGGSPTGITPNSNTSFLISSPARYRGLVISRNSLPGVPLRSTPGFMLPSAIADYHIRRQSRNEKAGLKSSPAFS
jgi:hypothetical protein